MQVLVAVDVVTQSASADAASKLETPGNREEEPVLFRHQYEFLFSVRAARYSLYGSPAGAIGGLPAVARAGFKGE